MFFAYGVCSMADVSSVSLSSEQTLFSFLETQNCFLNKFVMFLKPI